MNINSQTNTPNVVPNIPTLADLINYSTTISYNQTTVYDQNAMNIFIVDKLDPNITTLNPINAGVAQIPGVNSAFTQSAFLTSSLPHELGHNFYLLHTFGSNTDPNCELVSGLNSATAGDQVTDTPACYSYTTANLSPTCGYINPTNVVDCAGTPYVNCPVKNFMSRNTTCRTLGANYLPGNAEFTAGQGNRMRDFIFANIGNTSNIYGYNLAQNTISSLYQPYEMVPNLNGGIASVTDDGIPNGMSIVCRRLTGYTFNYQKGFNYIFNTYGNIDNLSVSQLPTYPDYGDFIITQLSPTFAENFGSVCYRGAQLCGLEVVTGGKIFTASNLLNAPITETLLTPQQAESEETIQNLEPHTFNVIIKEIGTGETKSQTIYKQN